jgi:hypothetical protein
MAWTLLGNGASMTRALALVSFASLLLFASVASGCGAVATMDDDAPEERALDRIPPTPPMWARRPAPAPASCETPAPLLVHHDAAGRVDRLHAQLTARGVLGNFLVDTGSLESFVTHEEVEEQATARTTIYCQTMNLPLIARLRPGTTPDGQPQAGVLGSDLIAHGAVYDLDLVKGTLAWYAPAEAPPPNAVVLPIEQRNGWLIASGIRLDGRDVRLVVDTGASNVIFFDKTPRASEVREDTVDGTASPITLYHGDGEIAFLGGVTRHVPVDRTDAFPTLEGLIAELGSDVVGLLGLTSMGRDRIVIGNEHLVMMLPPVVPNPR